MSSEVLVVLIGSGISLISSTIAGVLALRASNKKAKVDQELIVADAANRISEATERQIANMNQEVGRLGQQVDELRSELAEYKKGTRILIRQLKSAGIDPQWNPPA